MPPQFALSGEPPRRIYRGLRRLVPLEQCEPGELWREVSGFPDYEVSSFGRVWSKPRTHVRTDYRNGKDVTVRVGGRMLGASARYRKGRITLMTVALKPGGNMLLHHVVLNAFVGLCPQGMEACHNDGNAANNRLSNLRWDTHLENVHDSIRHGTHSPPPLLVGDAIGSSVLSEEDVIFIKRAPAKRGIGNQLARKYGVCKSLVSQIRRDVIWKHVS